MGDRTRDPLPGAVRSETDDGDALHTAVAVDPAGTVTAAWATADGRILAATRPPP